MIDPEFNESARMALDKILAERVIIGFEVDVEFYDGPEDSPREERGRTITLRLMPAADAVTIPVPWAKRLNDGR